jgi:hypothetical protein
LMFASLGFLGVLFSILLIRTNNKQNQGLELPTKQAQAKADASA